MFLKDGRRTNLVIMVSFEKASNDYRWRIGGRHLELGMMKTKLGLKATRYLRTHHVICMKSEISSNIDDNNELEGASLLQRLSRVLSCRTLKRLATIKLKVINHALLGIILGCSDTIPILVFPRAFEIFLPPSPHAFPLCLCPRLCIAILLLKTFTKLYTRLCFIHSCKTGLQHLKAHIASQESFPDIRGANNSAVLICFVNVSAYSLAHDVGCEPFQSFLSVGLRRSSKMCQFRCVNSCKANMYLLLH